MCAPTSTTVLPRDVDVAILAAEDRADDERIPGPGTQREFGIVHADIIDDRQHVHRSVAVMGAGAVGCYYGGMLALRRRPGDADRPRARTSTRSRATGSSSSARSAATSCAWTPRPTRRRARRRRRAGVRQVAGHARRGARDRSRTCAATRAVVSLQNGVDERAACSPTCSTRSCSRPSCGSARHGAARASCATAAAATWCSASRARAPADAAPRDRAREVAAMFERAGVRCPVVDDIDAALWTKLVVNCAFNAVSALGRSRYGRMARDAAVRELMEAAVREAVAVARAGGVALDEAAMLARCGARPTRSRRSIVDRAGHPARQADRDRHAERLGRAARRGAGRARAGQPHAARARCGCAKAATTWLDRTASG